MTKAVLSCITFDQILASSSREISVTRGNYFKNPVCHRMWTVDDLILEQLLYLMSILDGTESQYHSPITQGTIN